MTSSATGRRRWFRFSLRTFFVLLTAFCVWLGVQVKWIRDRHEALEWIRRQPNYDSTMEQYGGSGRSDDWKIGRPPWSLRILGESGVQMLSFYAASESEFHSPIYERHPEITRLFPEAGVSVYMVGPPYPPAPH